MASHVVIADQAWQQQAFPRLTPAAPSPEGTLFDMSIAGPTTQVWVIRQRTLPSEPLARSRRSVRSGYSKAPSLHVQPSGYAVWYQTALRCCRSSLTSQATAHLAQAGENSGSVLSQYVINLRNTSAMATSTGHAVTETVQNETRHRDRLRDKDS
jgi:hypothetical protein